MDAGREETDLPSAALLALGGAQHFPLEISMIRIRRAMPDDALAMARVRVETWRSAYAGIVPASYLGSLSSRRIADQWRRGLFAAQPSVAGAFVAEQAAGDIVGIAICGWPEGDEPEHCGQVHVLYVLPAFQRRGIGRLLMAACARHLVERGRQCLIVWVLKANPYRGFYEGLGGVLAGKKGVQIGEVELPEVAYRWNDVRSASWLVEDPARNASS
jgi:ribosomal protein S18 acetylase RimI-like enzyme